jgi:DinB superfamily
MPDIPAPLERFRRGPEIVAMALTGVFGEEEDFVPAPDRWSVRQIVAHLADSEVVAAHRIRQVLAEDNPVMTWFDEKLWATNLDYARRKPKQSLETFRRLRAENYELLQGAGEVAFERTGQHSRYGTKTLRQMVDAFGTHVETHARQIQEVRAAYQAARSAR